MQIGIAIVLLVVLAGQVVFLAIHHREFRTVLARYWPAGGLRATLASAFAPTARRLPAAE